jgi:hypothetical protein
MATPRLRIRRGTSAPTGSIALISEPFFDTTAGNFYVATATDAFAKIGGPTYTTRIDNFLTSHTGTVSAILKLGDADNSAQISISAPTTLAAPYTLTLPPNDGDSGQVLQSDGSGGLSWVTQTSGYTSWTLAGDSGSSQEISNTQTATIAGGSGITTVASATDTLTIDLNINELTAETALADTDTFAIYDASATANRKVAASDLAVYVLAEASGDVTFTNGVAAIAANSVELGTDTTGNYVASVATSATGGLNGGAAGSEGAAITLELKNNANLTNNTVLKWNATDDQLTNSIITDDGSTVTITGNLTINGTTTTVNATNTVISDRLLELANGTTGTPTADSGLIIVRGSLSNVFIGYDEGDDLFVAGTTAIDGSGTDAAPSPIVFLAGAFSVTDAAGSKQAVISYLAEDGLFTGSAAGRYLQNVTIDCGTY